MGKYLCTYNDVDELLGEERPEDASRSDLNDAVKLVDTRLNDVLEESDVSGIDEEVLAERLERAAASMAAHRVLLRAGERNDRVRLAKEAALDLMERIRDGAYAGDGEPEEAAETPAEEDTQ